MKIILNEVEYTAPALKTGLWFEIEKNRTSQKSRVAEIKKLWGKIIPYESKELTEVEEVELNTLMADCIAKTDENKHILLQEKIEIIVKAFDNTNVTIETILEHLPLANVAGTFIEIEKGVNDILAGRVEQFPNESTVTA